MKAANDADVARVISFTRDEGSELGRLIGGIALAGGVGFLVRKHGLTIVDLLAAELVTADGEGLAVDADTPRSPP